MITKFEKYNLLNEVLVHKDYTDSEINNDSWIISYKKYIYIVKDTQEEINQFITNLNIDQFSPDWYDGSDMSEIVDEMKERIPDMFIFTTSNNDSIIYYDVSGMVNYPVEPTLSNQFIETLKVLKNELNFDTISLYYNITDLDNEIEGENIIDIEDLINEFTKDMKVKKIPKYIYHGTSTSTLSKILKTGLRPSSGSNWKELYKSNKYLFFSSSKFDAQFYARNSAENTKSFPIILKIDSSCIDDAKIDFDFDFYITHVCSGNKYFDDMYNCSSSFNNIDDKKNRIVSDLENKVIGATYRKFAYQGNIYPKYIESIIYNETYESEFNEETDDFEKFEEMINFYEDAYSYDDYYIGLDGYDEYLEELENEEEI